MIGDDAYNISQRLTTYTQTVNIIKICSIMVATEAAPIVGQAEVSTNTFWNVSRTFQVVCLSTPASRAIWPVSCCSVDPSPQGVPQINNSVCHLMGPLLSLRSPLWDLGQTLLGPLRGPFKGWAEGPLRAHKGPLRSPSGALRGPLKDPFKGAISRAR